MKKAIVIILAVLSLVAAAITNSADRIPVEEYTVHEWGTFTSVSGSDGEILDGLFLEEEQLPGFVNDLHLGMFNGIKFAGFGIPRNNIDGVNIKMETPVIYFYSDKEREVDVEVKFRDGIMDQWYPDIVKRDDRYKGLKADGKPLKITNNMDFRKKYSDVLNWKVKVLSPDSYLSYTSPQNLETPTWVNPRFVDANMLQIGKQREKFIFYRGLARFQQPFKVTAQSDSQITLENTGDDKIGFALVYEYTDDRKAKVWWTGSLEGKSSKVVERKSLDVDESIHDKFVRGLVAAGLYKKEAVSMLETWRHSYFEKPGLRVFWIVPRKFTDEILPLKLNPAPKNLERVLVGRTEVLTPDFEEKIVRDFSNNEHRIPYWTRANYHKAGNYYIYGVDSKPDRFFKAWQNRVYQLTKGKEHKFSFTKQISGNEIKLGEFRIQRPNKKVKHFELFDVFNKSKILEYTEKSGEIDGNTTFYFDSSDLVKNQYGTCRNFKDRKAVFQMKNGQPDGECKIYSVDYQGVEKLIETKIFKDGKIL